MDAEFDFSALLRGDDKTRFSTYKEGIQGGIVTPNECRAEEGLAPMDGGDKLFLQAQMVPIEMLPQIGKTPAEPTPDPEMARAVDEMRSELRSIADRPAQLQAHWLDQARR